MIKDQMNKIYRSIPPDKIPWNMETPPAILQNIVDTGKEGPCKAFELGCGAGNYVIYLAGKGFMTSETRDNILAADPADKKRAFILFAFLTHWVIRSLVESFPEI